jgi:FixJ family two-component response regulator
MTEAKRRTVAIVDDDHAVLDSLPILLEVVGHAVEIFASAGRIGHHPTDELLHGLAAFGRRGG